MKTLTLTEALTMTPDQLTEYAQANALAELPKWGTAVMVAGYPFFYVLSRDLSKASVIALVTSPSRQQAGQKWCQTQKAGTSIGSAMRLLLLGIEKAGSERCSPGPVELCSRCQGDPTAFSRFSLNHGKCFKCGGQGFIVK